MALYTINHTYFLTAPRKAAVAARLSTLHSNTFSIPARSVATIFHWTGDTDGGQNPNVFIGGHVEEHANIITIQIRPVQGLEAEAKQVKLDAFTMAVWEVWDELIQRAPKKGFWTGKEKAREEGDRVIRERRKLLHSVFVVEGLGAGFMHGRMFEGSSEEGSEERGGRREIEDWRC